MSILVTDPYIEVIDPIPPVKGKIVCIDTTIKHPIFGREMLHRLIDEALDSRMTGEIRMNSTQGGVGFLLVVKREKA